MSFRCPVILCVAPVPDDLIDEFSQALCDDGIDSDPDQYLCPDGTYTICDDEAADGMLYSVENWLQRNNIAFTRESEGGSDPPREVVLFRPGFGVRGFSVDWAGEMLLPEDQIIEIAKDSKSIGEFLTKLGDFSGSNMPPLVPMSGTIGALSASELKRKNSDPSSTACAKCGGLLRNPFPGLKHCPVCEP